MEREFNRVWRAYGGPVFAYLVRMTGDRGLAEDLCQETFVRFLEHRDGIVGRNGVLGSWLYRVATRLALDVRRRRSPLPLKIEPQTGASGTRGAEEREIADLVEDEIDRLPDELRVTFLLRARQELTFPQIAAATEVSERSAKDRFKRARDRLFHRLGPLFRET
jgi:RNA polymerase sigma-70 factor, ECF subfamily